MGNILVAQVHRRPLAALLLICVLAWLPGFFTLPPLDRDESRFAQATKQMLESGDYININLGDGPRYEKPVGIYWLQAASTAVFGAGPRNQIWTYRIPSLLGALTAVAATFFLVRLFAGVETAFAAGLLLGMSVLLMSEAKIAKTDAALVGCITVAQAVLMRIYLSVRTPDTVAARHARPRDARLDGVRLGYPHQRAGRRARVRRVHHRRLARRPRLALAVAAARVDGLRARRADHRALGDRDRDRLRRPVLSNIARRGLRDQADRRAGDPRRALRLLRDARASDLLARQLALLPGIVLGITRWREPAIRYLLLWAATAWLMFEIAPTKLPHYVLPAYPAIAALCAVWLTDVTASSRSLRIAAAVSLALFVLVGIALGGFVAWAPEQYGGGGTIALYLTAGLGIVVALAVLVPALKGQRLAAAGIACLSAAIFYYAAGLLSVPRLDQLWLSPRLADSVARHAMPEDPPIVTAGYAEPSISFLLGTRTALETGAGAALIAGKTGGLVLVDSGENDTFLKLIAEAGGKAEALDEISGLNYSRGRETRITLYRVVPRAP